jgi:DeoR/GlpR family transcriptional regulator of sugar metabolism
VAEHNIARRDEILQLLRHRTSASIAEIAGQFFVSEMTVRRDLEKLAATGQVIRIPGGAMIARGTAIEKTFLDRSAQHADAKDRIGRAAAALIQAGDAVVMDSGTTTLFIARHLRRHQDVVVFTFSLAVLDELSGSSQVGVVLTGGTYRRSSHDLIGREVAEALRAIHAQKVFFGAAALSFTKGVMAYDPEFQRELLMAGSEKILVLDSAKIGHEALYHVCPVENCDLVITDSGIKPADLRRLRELTKVQVVE